MRTSILSIVLFCLPIGLIAQERDWSDNTGKYGIRATLLEFDGTIAHLRKPDGELIQVPLRRLSPKDQDYVRTWQPIDPVKSAPAENTTDWLADIKSRAKITREPGFDYEYGSQKPMPEVVVLLELKGQAAARAFAYGNLHIDEFIGNRDQKLTVETSDYGPNLSKEMKKISSRGSGFLAEHPEDGLRLQFKTMDPHGSLTTIKRISGQVQLLTGGQSEIVNIKDISRHPDGKIDSRFLEQQEIEVQFKRIKNQVDLVVKGDISHLASIVLKDDKGKQIEPEGWSIGGWDDQWTYSYMFDRIPNANLVLDFRIDPENVTVPFQVQNAKVPRSN